MAVDRKSISTLIPDIVKECKCLSCPLLLCKKRLVMLLLAVIP